MVGSRSSAVLNLLHFLLLAGVAFVRTRRQLAVDILALQLEFCKLIKQMTNASLWGAPRIHGES